MRADIWKVSLQISIEKDHSLGLSHENNTIPLSLQ